MQGYTKVCKDILRYAKIYNDIQERWVNQSAYWLLQFQENGKQKDEEDGSRLGHGVPGQQRETMHSMKAAHIVPPPHYRTPQGISDNYFSTCT